MQPRTTTRYRGKLLIILGIVVSAALLYVALAGLSIERLAETLARAELWPWLPLAVLAYLAGHWVRGLRLRVLVSREASLTTATGANIVVMGYAVNNILPFRMGELARMGMLYERTGIPFLQSASVTALERILDGLTIVLLLAFSMIFVTSGGWLTHVLAQAGLLFGCALAGVLVLVVRPRWVVAATSRLAGWLLPGRQALLLQMAANITAGVAYLRRLRDALKIASLSVLVWLLEAGMFWALMPAFGLEADPMIALLAMSVTNLGILAPSTPGYIGVFHFVCMQALVLVGIAEETALAYAILVHLAFFIPITAWGVGVTLWYGVKLSATLALAKAARNARQSTSEGAFELRSIGRLAPHEAGSLPAPFLVSITRALVPLPTAGLSEPEHEHAVAQAAQFVQAQREALPFKLRVLLTVGLFGFRLATALLTLRPFTALSPAAQRRHVNLWAYGRIGLTRKLFRPLRSTAILAYYDIPAITDALTHGTPDPAQTGGGSP